MKMVLRKVSEIDDTYDFPFSVIEQQDDGIIIEVQTTKTITSTVIEEQPDGTEIEVEISDVVEIDIDNIGTPATWMDVNNPLYFDFKIGDNVYSWMQKDGCRKVGITTAGEIGVVSYKPVRINNSPSNIRRIIVPKFTPLKLEGGRFTIGGVCRPEQAFIDASTGGTRTMNDILLVRDEVEKHLTYDEVSGDEFA